MKIRRNFGGGVAPAAMLKDARKLGRGQGRVGHLKRWENRLKPWRGGRLGN